MTREQGRKIRQGDEVTFGPHVYTVREVCSDQWTPRGWPFFRIDGEGWVSHDFCGRVTRNAGEYINASIDHTAATIAAVERRIMESNTETVQGYKHTCLYCGHVWQSFNKRPRVCTACKSTRWYLGRISPHYPKPKRP